MKKEVAYDEKRCRGIRKVVDKKTPYQKERLFERLMSRPDEPIIAKEKKNGGRKNKNAKKAKLLVHACYMVGNKGETKETMNETLRLALELNTDTAQFYTLHVYPGTEAYNWMKKNGFIDTDDFSKWIKEDGSDNTVIHTDDMSADELVDFCNNARKKYYLRPKYILKKLGQSLVNKDEFIRNVKGFKNLAPKLFKRKGKNE